MTSPADRKICLALCLALGLLCLLSACAPTGIYHTVESGQTLYRIAKTYDIPEAELARVNRIHDPTRLQVGQKIFIPDVLRPRQVKVRTVAEPAVSQPPVASSSPAPVAPKSAVPQGRAPAEKPSSATPSAKATFVWPVTGKVINSFGTRRGTANKGIEIACRKGSVVGAAAPGKVIYSGYGIRGYGHLVIIEHAQDFFTVYGYNEKNLVKTNDFVGQGDQVAQCGAPNQSESSRLHFEIRKGKAAVDPINYLP